MARSDSLPYRQVRQASALVMATDGAANGAIARAVGVKAEHGAGRGGLGSRWAVSRRWVGCVRGGGASRGFPLRLSRRSWRTRWGGAPRMVRRIGRRGPWRRATVSARTRWRVCGGRWGLRPWRVETFKLSNDPRFEAKLVDVVGLYLDPPESAVVLCVDEKSQCQALERSQPSLPMTRGRAATMTHDYKRHGHDDAVRRAERRDRRGSHRLPAPAPPPGVPGIPETDRTPRPRRVGRAPHHRQLRGPQTRQRHEVAPSPPAQGPLAHPLHAHLRVVAEPRGALVQRTHRQTTTPRQLHQREPTHRRHRNLDRPLEPKPQTPSSGTEPPKRSSPKSAEVAPPSTTQPKSATDH